MKPLAIALSNSFIALCFIALSTATLAATGCAAKTANIPGTEIVDAPTNREVINAVEEYRLAVERRDTAALLLMASKSYWEDGGTPKGGDDYGYDGLRQVLQNRFQQAADIRYSLRYVNIYRRCKPGGDPKSNEGCRAYIDVLIDASYSVQGPHGNSIRRDKRDQNQLVLEWSGEKWLFLSGM